MKIKLRCVKPCSIKPGYFEDSFSFELGKEYCADFSKYGVSFFIENVYTLRFDPDEFSSCFISADDTEVDRGFVNESHNI